MAREIMLTEAECIERGMNPAWWYGMDCDPCCGLHPRLMDAWDRGDRCYYECPSCGKRTALFDMPWQARDAWNRGGMMSDTDATRARQDVVADVDEILEHVINANMLSMPYDVYYELFDAVAGLGVKVEKLQAENDKLRELVRDLWRFTGTACKKYPRLFDQSAQGGQMVMPNMLDSFEQRMRELGAEV